MLKLVYPPSSPIDRAPADRGTTTTGDGPPPAPPTPPCGYRIAWADPCTNPTPCPDHDRLPCDGGCGTIATHQCSAQFSPFMDDLVWECGANLCDGCGHVLTADGVHKPPTAADPNPHLPLANHVHTVPWWRIDEQ